MSMKMPLSVAIAYIMLLTLIKGKEAMQERHLLDKIGDLEILIRKENIQTREEISGL